jgi:hypothetical protein
MLGFNQVNQQEGSLFNPNQPNPQSFISPQNQNMQLQTNKKIEQHDYF